MSEPREPVTDEAWREAWNWMVEMFAKNDGDVALIEEALEAVREGTARAAVARLHDREDRWRLVRVSTDLLSVFGTRTETGDRITAEWGEPDADGIYDPIFRTTPAGDG